MTTPKEKKIYLGKKGKVYGPYPSEEFKEIHRSGEINNYTFIWDSTSEKWNPIETPPPAPEGKRTSSTSTTLSWADMEVFCHDFVNVVMGKLESVTETGCDLIASDGGEHPRLGIHSSVVLNLVADGRSINVKATLGHVLREQREKSSKWIYRLEWDGTPSFIHAVS